MKREYSAHQQKIIRRYYDNRENIALTKLQELVGELYLVESDKKRERLWERIGLAMTQLHVPPKIAAHILERRDPKVLASNIEDWLKNPPQPPAKPETPAP